MNVANVHYHSLLGDNISFSGFQLFRLVVQATNTGGRSHGYEARAEPHRTGNVCTAAIRSSPEGMRECMDEFNFEKFAVEPPNIKWLAGIMLFHCCSFSKTCNTKQKASSEKRC